MLRKAIEFGLYPWFPAHGYSYIHPSNRRDFEAITPHDKVFEKIDENERWILLQYGHKQFKVEPDLYSRIPALPFSFGDLVEEVNRTPGQLRLRGEVFNIFWHPSEDQAYFQIRQGKQEIARRFRADELRKA
ncbi:hypothetical protein AAE02nite_06110 [Adhaeribacter aerolatus]|uniref:Uncharacterized protein n=1 Tax=Adhaeribacter aerolatus TaxID=670289 RepID=A0A512ATM7_9BACT|nr:hypothetical protein [Adhaeribacter aerolatus]GEO02947.1 hypothetical protein AAE02nite_06110 [Adhaeribacter aerolatus]